MLDHDAFDAWFDANAIPETAANAGASVPPPSAGTTITLPSAGTTITLAPLAPTPPAAASTSTPRLDAWEWALQPAATVRRRSHESRSDSAPRRSAAGPQRTPAAEKKTRATGNPLRRGDACLMCRAKKLKCSATKPSCEQCSKRNDRCVYDAVRPASRVEKLEQKLQEMEEADMRAAQHAAAVRRHAPAGPMGMGFSGMAMQQPLAHAHHLHQPPPQTSLTPQFQSTQLPHPDSSPFEYGMFQFLPPSSAVTQQSQPQEHPQHPQHPLHLPHGRATSLPQPARIDGMSWNWPTQPPPPAQHPPAEPLASSSTLPTPPWALLSHSNNVSTPGFWPGSIENTPPPDHEAVRPGSSATSQAALTPTLGFMNQNITLGSGFRPDVVGTGTNSNNNSPFSHVPDPFSDKSDDPFGGGEGGGLGLGFGPPHGLGLGLNPMQPQDQTFDHSTSYNLLGIVPSETAQTTTTATQNGGGRPGAEEKDIMSQNARDYLLKLYFDFSESRNAPPAAHAGSEGAHDPISQEDFKAEDAHPSLVLAMCTIGASRSHIPAVRSLIRPLKTAALRSINEGHNPENLPRERSKGLMDLIQAMTILGAWMTRDGAEKEKTEAEAGDREKREGGENGESGERRQSAERGERGLEGYLMLGRAVSLTFACGLHTLPSSIHDADGKQDRGLIGPPSDEAELDKRVQVFWDLWIAERIQALVLDWPSRFTDEEISTPLPLPAKLDGSAEGGNLGIAKVENDDGPLRLGDLYATEKRVRMGEMCLAGNSQASKILSLHLLYRARLLSRRRPESHHPASEAGTKNSSETKDTKDRSFLLGKGLSHGPEGNGSAGLRYTHPMAYREIMSACDALRAQIVGSTGTRTTGPTLQNNNDMLSCLFATRMILHETGQGALEMDMCLQGAHEIARMFVDFKGDLAGSRIGGGGGIEAAKKNECQAMDSGLNGLGYGTQPMEPEQEDVRADRASAETITAMPVATGFARDISLLIGRWTVDRLIRCAAVYRTQGNETEAEECLMEARGVVEDLKAFGLAGDLQYEIEAHEAATTS